MNRLLEWWNRFTTKQKTLIIAIVCGAVLALVIIVTVLRQPQYVLLRECETTAEAAEVRDLLEGEGLDFNVSDDGLTVSILKTQQSDANLLLGANNIQAASYGIENVTDGSFSTTWTLIRKWVVGFLIQSVGDLLVDLEIII